MKLRLNLAVCLGCFFALPAGAAEEHAELHDGARLIWDQANCFATANQLNVEIGDSDWSLKAASHVKAAKKQMALLQARLRRDAQTQGLQDFPSGHAVFSAIIFANEFAPESQKKYFPEFNGHAALSFVFGAAMFSISDQVGDAHEAGQTVTGQLFELYHGNCSR